MPENAEKRTYAQFRDNFIARNGPLEVAAPWWEKAAVRQPREPEEPEGPVVTVVNGFTGQSHTVPRPDGGQPAEAPAVTHRPYSVREWDSVQNKFVSSRPAPQQGKPRRKTRRRRQHWKMQGLGGYQTPRSQ
jgi:hypothetical protein